MKSSTKERAVCLCVEVGASEKDLFPSLSRLLRMLSSFAARGLRAARVPKRYFASAAGETKHGA